MLRLVDSHSHFWDPGRLRYTWLDDLPSLNRRIVPAEVTWHGADWRVEAVVFVQADCAPSQGMQEVEWVTGLARADSRLRGIVAHTPLELGAAVRPVLAALQQNPLVKGVRRLIQSEAPGFATQPGFIAGVALLAEFGLTCELCVRHFQLSEVTALVRQCPDVRFVLDHLGKPDVKAGRLDPWRSDLAALAALPNVQCKLSGLVTEADWHGWRPTDLRPYIHHALDVFGMNRVMFGSDFPVLTLAASYERWFETLREAVSGLSAAEQERVFFSNGVEFYRLELEFAISEGQ